jgi:hypothetical protein
MTWRLLWEHWKGSASTMEPKIKYGCVILDSIPKFMRKDLNSEDCPLHLDGDTSKFWN